MNKSICSERFNTLLKVIGMLLVVYGFFFAGLKVMLVGIFLILLVISNMLTCEAYELSNQIGSARDELKDEIKRIKNT